MTDPVEEVEAALAKLSEPPCCGARYARLKAKEAKWLPPLRWGEETGFGWRRRDYAYVAAVHAFYHRDSTGAGAARAKAEDDARFRSDFACLATRYQCWAAAAMRHLDDQS